MVMHHRWLQMDLSVHYQALESNLGIFFTGQHEKELMIMPL